jgi:hypothetical protein
MPKQHKPNWTWKHMTLNKGLRIKCPIQSTIKTKQACFMTTQASLIPLRVSSEWNRVPNIRNVGFQTFTVWSHLITSHIFSSHSQSYKIVVFSVKSSWKRSKCILYPIVLCKSHMGTPMQLQESNSCIFCTSKEQWHWNLVPCHCDGSYIWFY